MLAMHMANELLTPGVAAGFMVIAGVVLMLAGRAVQGRLDPARVPLMGVLGAFVFAAQMINFPIVSGTSGHLVGSLLLAIVLGPHAASLVMASILIVQCLIFQDGGLLAIGTNILNMGIVPCYVGFAIFRAIAGPTPSTGRMFGAIFAASLIGVCAGAALVPVETRLSGVLAVSFAYFLLIMVGLHLLVATVEAFITFAVVAYLVRVRPAVLEASGVRFEGAGGRLSSGAVAGSILVAGLLLAGIGSLFASKYPDALDSLTGGRPGQTMVRPNENAMVGRASQLQEHTAPLPDYGVRGHGAWWGTTTSGIVGTLATLFIVWLVGRHCAHAGLLLFQSSLMANMLKRDPEERFSDRVDDYVRYRPGYPAGVLEVLGKEAGAPSPWDVADVGSGTGIFAQLLLGAGHRVLAVEPNAAMRAAAERELGNDERFQSVAGSAESTGLPDASVDLVTAAQAFNWFDAERTRREFARVLRPGGAVALIWNTRTLHSPFARDYEAFLTRFGSDYNEVGQRHRHSEAQLARFFGPGGYRRFVLANAQQLDFAGLRGRVMSSSYMPREPGPQLDAMLVELERLFVSHQQNEAVVLEYETEAYVGAIGCEAFRRGKVDIDRNSH